MLMRMRLALAGAAVAGSSLGAFGQTPGVGPRANQYPDVIVSSVGGSYDGTGTGSLGFYGVSNGIAAYAIGSDSCNIGTAPAIWMDTTAGFTNQHPVIGSAMYRMFNGRFEQIGMSWLKHGFCAADSCSHGNNAPSTGPAGCSGLPTVGGGTCQGDLGSTSGNCDWLGYGRATDTYGAGLNSSQGGCPGCLGPRSEINPWTGSYPYPPVKAATGQTTCLLKRLQIRNTDLDPANYPRYNASTNPTGSQYFAEIVYIFTDEWPTERYNNYSYRKVVAPTTTATSSVSGCTGPYYALDFTTGTGNLTFPMHPAIDAWAANDPGVTAAQVDAPNDGRFYISAKATNLGNGTWQYEYAVFNMNSDRGAASFSIPKSPAAALSVSSLGFHAPEYHSGESYDASPWAGAVNSSSIDWSCTPWATNANANALRWSTLYNFRFVANVAPKNGPNFKVRLGLFKPGIQVNDPTYVEVGNLPVPGDPPCAADFNHSGYVSVQDLFDFLVPWFNLAPAADFNGVNGVTQQDLFDFLAAWFVGC